MNKNNVNNFLFVKKERDDQASVRASTKKANVSQRKLNKLRRDEMAYAREINSILDETR